MPIHIINAPDQSAKEWKRMQDLIRETLNLSPEVSIGVGATETRLSWGGIKLTIPFGVVHLNKGETPLSAPLIDFIGKMGVAVPTAAKAAPAGLPAADNDEEIWMLGVAGQLFPGILPLHKAGSLYQPVGGTTKGSIYRVCFLGPNLRGACRIHSDRVSFRFTTATNTAPDGDVAKTLMRLGLDGVYADRLTGHSVLSADYATAPSEFRALFGAYYAALRPWVSSGFPNLDKIAAPA